MGDEMKEPTICANCWFAEQPTPPDWTRKQCNGYRNPVTGLHEQRFCVEVNKDARCPWYRHNNSQT